MIEQLLAQFDFHLATDSKHQLPGDQTHHAHGRRQQHNPAGLPQYVLVGEATLQVIDHPFDFKWNGHAEDVDHHQRDRAEHHLASVGLQIPADQIEAEGGHRDPWTAINLGTGRIDPMGGSRWRCRRSACSNVSELAILSFLRDSVDVPITRPGVHLHPGFFLPVV